MGAPTQATPSSTCHGPGDFGTTYLGSVWPGGFRAVPVYSNGVSGSFTDCLHSTRTPKGRVVVDGYMWQCVELIDRLYLTKGWIESSWLGNGNQLFSTAPRSFAKQRQGYIVRVHPGDVISFNAPGGGAGHAAVVARVQGSYLTIVNQNTDRASVLSHAYLRHGRIEMVGWAGWAPIGVVHAPTNSAPRLKVAAVRRLASVVDDGYSRDLASRGGTGSDRWRVTAGSLPAGLVLTRSGAVRGVGITTGTYRFSATVRDSGGAAASEAVQMHVAPDVNQLADSLFAKPRLDRWQVLRTSASDIVHTKSVTGLAGLPAGTSELQIGSSVAGGSIFQKVPVAATSGNSYSFSAWVKALGVTRPSESVCLKLSSITGWTRDRAATCRTVGTNWTQLTVPYDANAEGASALMAQIVTGTAHSRIAIDGTQLVGNGLAHAAFARNNASSWKLLRARRGAVVNGRAYHAATNLPEGSNLFQLNSSRAGGSVYQDIRGRIARGQRFQLTSWVRANGSSDHASVCLVLWELGGRTASKSCRVIGTSWVQLSVPAFVSRAGGTGLRAQLYVETAHQNVDVSGSMLRNTTG